MAESVVSSAVERLGDLLVQEAKFLHGVRRQIELIQIELELMQSYLEDADRRQIQEKRVRTWISKIRETAYDVEDVVETFFLKVASRRKGGIKNAFKRGACLLNEAAELHKVGSEIEDIKNKITTLTRCLETYGIKHIREPEEGLSSVIERQRQWRQSYSHEVEEFTVGLEEDVENLVKELVKEDEQSGSVVSICGMGGLGKTTLAKKVYHHQVIKRHFGGGLAWVFISQQFQPRNIWEGILFNLLSPSPEERKNIKKLPDGELADKLSKVQQKGKYLVILDDIWTKEAWDRLCHAFPVRNSGSKSKILLTTRNEEVAKHVDPRGFLHKLRLLDGEDGWKLLQKKAFPGESEHKIDDKMKNFGQQMVESCRGLPLAIVVLGGILATKSTDDWGEVYENINSYLRSNKCHEQQQSGVTGILSLSYHELPYQLKPCFLHLGNFPEDFNIPIKKLVKMWVAEGLVSQMQYEVKGVESLEDVAECYLGELLNRNMVLVGERGSTGKVKTCRLHDFMRDLCLLMAKEENFLQIYHNQDGNDLMAGSLSSTVTIPKPSHRIRRIAIICEGDNAKINSWKSKRTPYLRSLLYFSTRKKHQTIEKMTFKFCDFKLLRVLDFENYNINMLPRAIGDLIHLRCLILSFSRPRSLLDCCQACCCLSSLVCCSLGYLCSSLRYCLYPAFCCCCLGFCCCCCCCSMTSFDRLPDFCSTLIDSTIKIPSSISNLRCLQTLVIKSEKDTIYFEVPDVIWKLEQLRHLYLPPDTRKKCWSKLRLGKLKELQTLQNFDARVFDVTELTEVSNLKKLGIVGLNRFQELEGVLISPTVSKNRLCSLQIRFNSAIEEFDLQGLFSSCHKLCKLVLKGPISKLPKYLEFPQNLTKLTLEDSNLEENPMEALEKLPNLSVLRLLKNSFMGKQMICSEKGFPQLKSLQLSSLDKLEEWHVDKEAMLSLCELKIVRCCRLKMVPDGLRFITTLRKFHIIGMLYEFEKRVKKGGEDSHKVQQVPSIIFESW